MVIVLCQSDSHRNERLVPAAGNDVGRKLSAFSPSGTASSTESCLAQGHAPAQGGPHPIAEGEKALANSANLEQFKGPF